VITDRRTLSASWRSPSAALLAAMALWSLGDRVSDTDRIAAAVVNLDEPVTTGTGAAQQTVAAGRLLAAGLTSPGERSVDEQRLDWQLTDAADARAGLDAGTYDAVVTIPKDFSATVAALSRNEARRATFDVRSKAGSGALLGLLSDDVGRVAAAQLGQRITGTYLEGLYGETARLGVRLGRAADAAGRIGGGAAELSAGAGRLAGGAGDLGQGVGTLANGATELQSGTQAATDGAGRISSGLDRLAGGAGTLSSATQRWARGGRELQAGIDRLGGGVDRLAGGTADLDSGLAGLDRSVQPLPGQAQQLADGSAAVSEGVSGWARVLTGWQQACSADPTMTRYAALCAATEQAVGADGATADRLVGGAAAVASGSRQLADAAPRLVAGVGAPPTAPPGSTPVPPVGRRHRASGRGADGSPTGRTAPSGRDAWRRGTARRHRRGPAFHGHDRLRRRRAAGRRGGCAPPTAPVIPRARTAGAGASQSAPAPAGSPAALERGRGRAAVDDRRRQKDLAGAVAAPVRADTGAQDPADTTTRGIAPAVLALVLWLGAAVVYLVRPALPPARLAEPGLPWRVALAGWRPGLLIGVVQALLLVPVLVAFGVPRPHLGLLVVGLALTGAVFAALVQGIVARLGRSTGRAVVVVLTAVQAVLLAGLLPIDAAPALVRALNGLLPVPAAADLVRAGVSGGAVLAPVLLLVVWGAAGLVLSTRSARRAATVTVADLRPERRAVAA